jgi:hypothetical protein
MLARAARAIIGVIQSAFFRADENQHRLPSVVFDCPGGPIPELHSESSRLFFSRSPYRQGLRDAGATPGVLWRGSEVTRGSEIGVGGPGDVHTSAQSLGAGIQLISETLEQLSECHGGVLVIWRSEIGVESREEKQGNTLVYGLQH